MPVDTEVDATLILHRASFAETIGIKRGIAEGIETIERHQRDPVTTLQAQAIDGSQSPVLIHRRLTIEGKAVMNIAIVCTEVHEVRSLSGMLTIKQRGVGSQFSIQMGGNRIQTCMDAMLLIADISSEGGVSEVVFLLQFSLRAMIARGDNGGSGTILIKGGIHRPIRQEACCREAFRNRQCGSCTLQIVGCATGGMSTQGGGGAA